MGQGGSGEPPPLAGLLLRVGSPWHVHVSVFHYAYPHLVLTSMSEGSEVALESAELRCAITNESCLLL